MSRRWTEKFAEELRGRHYAGQLTIDELLEISWQEDSQPDAAEELVIAGASCESL